MAGLRQVHVSRRRCGARQLPAASAAPHGRAGRRDLAVDLRSARIDPTCSFKDLGDAVRKAEMDNPGVKIEFRKIAIGSRTRRSTASGLCAGTISYPEIPTRKGEILYIKPSYFGEMPIDIRSYAEANGTSRMRARWTSGSARPRWRATASSATGRSSAWTRAAVRGTMTCPPSSTGSGPLRAIGRRARRFHAGACPPVRNHIPADANRHRRPASASGSWRFHHGLEDRSLVVPRSRAGRHRTGPPFDRAGRGCFWCTEAVYSQLDGVLSVRPGYAGDGKATADYRTVSTGRTNHAEVIEVVYDSGRIGLGRS